MNIRFLQISLVALLLQIISYAQSFNWEWQNPLPTGADHNDAVVLAPDKFLLFGNGSAVSLSTDAGITWSISYIDSNARDIYDVIFPDQNTGYLVGTGGLIMKTTNGGENWMYQASGVTGTLWDVDFINNDTGYAVGASGNILKTTDGGNIWSVSVYGTTTIYKVHFVNDTLIFLGSASTTTGRLLRSTNGGTTWDNITANITGLDGTVRGIHFLDENTGWISNSTGKIFKTIDGGASGGIIYDIGSTTATIYEVKFLNANDGYAMSTAGRVLKTTNGGTNWDLIQTDATENLFGLGIQGVNSELSTPVLIGGDIGTILTSSDDGVSWQMRNSSVTNEILYRLCFPTELVGYAVGGSITTGNSFGDILKTTNSGTTWTKLPFDPGYRTYSVFFLNENLGYVGVQGPTGLYKTTNGGQDWIQLNTGTGTSSSSIYDIKFYDQNLGFAMYGSGQVARTTNGGDNWTAVSAGWGSAAGYEIFVVNSSVIYLCGGGNRVSKSTNGGVSFTQITTLGTVTLYSMHFFDENNGYIAGSGGKLYKTTNGSTFTEIQLPTAATLYSIRFIDNNFGLIGAASGNMFYTTDGGDNWLPSQIYVGTSQTIRDIRFAGTKVWLVGSDGLIIRGNTGASSTFQLSVDVADGWNMVSVPGTNPDGMGVTSWWADLTGTVYKFVPGSGYSGITTTAPGEGYWLKNVGTETYSYPAIEIVTHDPISATAGWNMFGAYENSVDPALLTTTPADQIIYPIYKFVPGSGYAAAASIDPGYGYWVKVASDCQINFPSAALAKGKIQATNYFKDDLPEGKVNWGRITVTDAEGQSYTLYAVKGQVDLNRYELPPVPPAGVFDIRYSNGRVAEDINSSAQGIDLRGVTYPLKVKADGMDIRLEDVTGKEINTNIKSGEEITINNPAVNKLMVSGQLIPDKYSLEQNYPNPFNPGTTIEFSLPENVKNVTISIYNVLGEKVAELVNGAMQAGKYRYQWNAKNFASGIYVYELRTDKFVSVKKMLLLK
jgi:photosystem II stability/assembly factor-like uncharacterized protein